MIDITERGNLLQKNLSHCTLCGHRCGADRLNGRKGICRTAADFSVASYNVHFGEEPPVSGERGSGTIFFSNCNLSCVFCQNYPISHLGNGNPCTVDRLADIMLELQEKRVHNINLVTPTHVTPQIVAALARARSRGLTLPLVYNCGGYEGADMLKLLDGIIDIYLPDMKYGDDAAALRCSGAASYWDINTRAVREMYRQVGQLQLDDDGIARKGLIIRHLILPGGTAASRRVLSFIAEELSPDVHISLMSQYHPAHNAAADSPLNRRITQAEYDEILAFADELNLQNGWRQEL